MRARRNARIARYARARLGACLRLRNRPHPLQRRRRFAHHIPRIVEIEARESERRDARDLRAHALEHRKLGHVEPTILWGTVESLDNERLMIEIEPGLDE